MINSNKKILYLSNQHRYLCDDLFAEIVSVSDDFEHIYLDSDYNSTQMLDASVNERYHQKMRGIFHHYIHLSCKQWNNLKPSLNYFLKIRNVILTIVNRRKWVKEFLRQIEIIKPDAVICIDDFPINFQLLTYYFTEIPIFILQPATSPRSKKNIYNRPKALKEKSIIDYYVNKIFFPYSNETENVKSNVVHLIWGEFWLNSELQMKYPNTKAVGSIPFDIVLKNRITIQEKKEIKLSAGITENRNLILITLNKKRNIGENRFLEFIEIYKKVILKNPVFFFILKVHPVEDEAYINSLFTPLNVSNYIVIKNKIPIKQLIYIANIFITHWSSTLYEAMARLIPVILVNPNNQYDYSVLCLENYAIFASDSKSLSEYIQRSVNPSYKDEFINFRNQFIDKQIFRTDGKSAERVVEVIKEVLSNKVR